MDLKDRLGDAVVHRIQLARQRVDQLADRPALRKPLQRVRDLEQELDETVTRLQRAAKVNVQRHQDKLVAVADQLESLSPLNVLKRGYSLTKAADGEHLIRSVTDVKPGERIITRVADGEIESVVQPKRDSGTTRI